MDSGYISFLSIWDRIITILSVVLLAGGILTFIFHAIKFQSIKSFKQKYDYLRDYDAKMIYYGIVLVGLSITLFINTVYTDTVRLNLIWFFVRLFVSVSLGTLIIYLAYLVLKYAYPATLDKKLHKWRYRPRVNQKTGNMMKLLSEEEEDVHLDEGMQAEENVFSVDYDVWVDEVTGEVHIEKYPGHLEAQKCNTCGFQTMKQIREEIVKAPTHTEEGLSMKYYECSYCGAKRHREFNIATLNEDEQGFKIPENPTFKEDLKVQTVGLEILISNGKSHKYEFQNVNQAKNFLEEFDLENIDY